MNLVKNGAVLLAALGMFAATSCGSKSQTLTYDKACKWVEEHYDSSVTKKTTDKYKFKWDFSKTEEASRPFVIQILKSRVDKSVEDIKGDFVDDDEDTEKAITPEKFKETVEELKDPKFSTSGNKLTIIGGTSIEPQEGVTLSYLGEIVLDSKCFMSKTKYTFDNVEVEAGPDTYTVNGYLAYDVVYA